MTVCCCGSALAVLEPGAGFGSWRSLFGSRRERRAQSWTETKDITVEHVTTVASASSQAASSEGNVNQIEQISSNLTVIEHD
jgi:hypothetical protein